MQHNNNANPRVVLCLPPCPQELRIGEHLGLYYIDAYLKSKGVATVLLDGTNSDFKDVIKSIMEVDPLYIGITLPSHYLAESVSRLASKIKEHTNTKIVVGGHIMCFKGREFLNYANCVDIVVTHEGEIVSWELVKCFDSNTDIRHVRGILYRADDGNIRSTKSRKVFEYLDRLPFPTRPIDMPAFSVITGRGCYAKCSFCSVRAYTDKAGGKRWRRRSVENVALEIEELCHSKNARAISFVDDTFLGPGKIKHYAVELASEIHKRCPNLGWAINCRTPDVNFETISILKENGLCNIGLGLESASEHALQRMNKGATNEDNKKALQIAKELSLSVLPYFIFFEAETAFSEIEVNLQFLREHNLARPTVLRSQIVPYPGTGIYKTYKKAGLLKEHAFSYKVIFKNNMIDIISNAYNNVFKSVLNVEYNIQKQEFEADLLALHGDLYMKREIEFVWSQLSNTCLEIGCDIYDTVRNEGKVSSELLIKWKKIIGEKCIGIELPSPTERQ